VRRAARCEASAGAPKGLGGRRGAVLGGGAALLAGLGGVTQAEAVVCNMVTPCMPGQ